MPPRRWGARRLGGIGVAAPLEQLEQLRERRGDRAHDPHERDERRVDLAALDRGEMAAAQSGAVGDVGLRKAVPGAQLGDGGSEVTVLRRLLAALALMTRQRDGCLLTPRRPMKVERPRLGPVSGMWIIPGSALTGRVA